MAETRTARRPRRPARDEEPEEQPTRRRGRGREDTYDEDKNEPEERGSRRRSATRPSRRAAPRTRDEEPPDEDDGDDGDGDGRKRESVKGGWGTWRQRKAEASDFADDFKVEYKEKYLVLFLDAEPFAAFTEHWVDEVPKGTKKSWICIGKGCPLCEALGEKPAAKAMFNVVEFIKVLDENDNETREGIHKVWTVGSGVANLLEEKADDVGLEGNFFKVYKVKKGSGKGGSTDYHCEHVKDRDLPDDWDFDGISDEEYDEFVKARFDGSYVRMPSKAKLREIAEMVLDED